jgi:hypothetical protein
MAAQKRATDRPGKLLPFAAQEIEVDLSGLFA